MTSDPFDVDKLALTDEQVRERLAIVPRKIRKQRQQFIKVPWVWAERLAKAHYAATYRVALHVLHQHWKKHGEPFTLANGDVGWVGVSPRQKWRALGELEQLGLVRIERRPRKSPRITIVV
jgi:hypothetical protein